MQNAAPHTIFRPLQGRMLFCANAELYMLRSSRNMFANALHPSWFLCQYVHWAARTFRRSTGEATLRDAYLRYTFKCCQNLSMICVPDLTCTLLPHGSLCFIHFGVVRLHPDVLATLQDLLLLLLVDDVVRSALPQGYAFCKPVHHLCARSPACSSRPCLQ